MKAVLAILLAASAADPGVIANPPLVLRIEREGVFRTPSGDIRVPAGAELDACSDGTRTMSYLDGERTVVIP